MTQASYKPDGTEGTATAEMKYKNGKTTPKFYGCIVKNDTDLWKLIKNDIKKPANMEKLKSTEYFFYTCDPDFTLHETNIKTCTSCTVTCHRFSWPNKLKSCELKWSEDTNNFIKVQELHIFYPICAKNFNNSKFLRNHSKRIQERQTNLTERIYGLSYEGKKSPKFIPLKLTHKSSNVYGINAACYKMLEDASPVLLQDGKTVVGSLKKKENDEISISIFGIMNQETTSASCTDGGSPGAGTGDTTGTPTPSTGAGTGQTTGTPTPATGAGTGQTTGTPAPEGGRVLDSPNRPGDNQQSDVQDDQDDRSSDNSDGILVGVEQQVYLRVFFEKDPENIKALARYLDRRSLVIKNYEDLAGLLRAPLLIIAKCKCNTEHSPTIDLLQCSEVSNLSVKALVGKLRAISQNHEANEIERRIPGGQREHLSVKEAMNNHGELFEEVASRLDTARRINWKTLGRKLGFKPDELNQIKLGCNPAERLLEDYVYPTLKANQLTVGRFRQLITKINRTPILKTLLQETEEDSRSIKEVIPPQSEKMRKLCLELNTENVALKNWRHLAFEWGISHETYSQFEPDQKLSPTEILLKEWLVSEHPGFTVNALCHLLSQIDRNDAKTFLERKLQEYS